MSSILDSLACRHYRTKLFRFVIQNEILAPGLHFLHKMLRFEGDRRTPQGKFNLGDQLFSTFGFHRSGWNYVVRTLRALCGPEGTYLDCFVEQSFSRLRRKGEPRQVPWVGFVHVPPNIPTWFDCGQSNETVIKSEIFQKSLDCCKGLFVLSDYHKRALSKQVHVPVHTVFHPTEFPEITWSWERFLANRGKKIVQVGYWLRRLHSIFLLSTNRYEKIVLEKHEADMAQLMKAELENEFQGRSFDRGLYETVCKIPFLPDRQYDRLLSENIVFLHLYDTSANNAIIECMARNTPILINPLDAVVEYLGPGYPLYFNSLDEAAEKAEDFDLIRAAHCYLVDLPTKAKLKGDYFLNSVVESDMYKRL